MLFLNFLITFVLSKLHGFSHGFLITHVSMSLSPISMMTPLMAMTSTMSKHLLSHVLNKLLTSIMISMRTTLMAMTPMTTRPPLKVLLSITTVKRICYRKRERHSDKWWFRTNIFDQIYS